MLKRFEKVELEPDESQVVHFNLQSDDFSFYGVHLSAGRVLEDGTFTLRIGNLMDGNSTLVQTFTLGDMSGTSGGDQDAACSGPGDPNCAGGGGDGR